MTQLLEDIKKQKAFSFTLKGSLGVMGVFLTLSIFGVLGGGHLLCDKGTQTQIGAVRILSMLDEDPPLIPALSKIIDYFSPRQSHSRTVLIKSDQTVIRLPYTKAVDAKKFANYSVIATGTYDSCAQTLTLKDPNGIETYLSL